MDCFKIVTKVLTVEELQSISDARLEDAQSLFNAGHYDAATYLCGYALELALKAKICDTLNWPGFPETISEFRNYHSFKTHDLRVLLHLSGAEGRISAEFGKDWNSVQGWNSERWYDRPGQNSSQAAEMILASTREIKRALWSR